MFLSPIILAILAGVLLGATGLYQSLIPSGAAAVLDACTDFISAPVGALILLAIFSDNERQRVYLSSVLSLCTLVTLMGFAVLAMIG